MNKFIEAIKSLDLGATENLINCGSKWITWQEPDGKNALHYLGGLPLNGNEVKETVSLQILQLLLKNGMDINSIHSIKDGCGFFPATPLWYAYTRGRNKPLYTWLLENGANPQNCMFAIAWYNDVEAAALFKNHGADIEAKAGADTPFMGAFNWKRYEIAEWFLQQGANVNTTDDKGNTTLHYAVKRKLKPEQINLLLQFGADAEQENHEGVSPKKLAEQNRQRNILNIFSKNSVNK